MLESIKRFFRPTMRWTWSRMDGQIHLTCPSQLEQWWVNSQDEAWSIIAKRSQVGGWLKIKIDFIDEEEKSE